jgi:hypothetical protein
MPLIQLRLFEGATAQLATVLGGIVLHQSNKALFFV